MQKLLITLLLISPFSFADWGDVYYCLMTSFAVTDHDGKLQEVELGKFQFKLDETEKAMVFGEGGYFANIKMSLEPKWSYADHSIWLANDYDSTISFFKGKLMYSRVQFATITSLTADCDKF